MPDLCPFEHVHQTPVAQPWPGGGMTILEEVAANWGHPDAAAQMWACDEHASLLADILDAAAQGLNSRDGTAGDRPDGGG